MEESQNGSLSTISSIPINTINGIKFSSREIDILACIIGGRTAKKIAVLLSLSPRTVENYIHNITLKLECNSRESLIDFIERSDKLFIIKEHYLDLLIQAEFEKSLREILKLSCKESLSCLLVYWKNTALRKSFIHSLQKHLKLAGLTISVEAQKEIKLFSLDTLEFPGVDYVICIVSHSILEELQEEERRILLSQKTTQSKKNIFFLLLERGNSIRISRNLMDFGTVDFIEEQNYYFLIFEALKKLLPHLYFEKIILEFKEKYENINNSHRGVYPRISLEGQKLENKENTAKLKIVDLLKKRKWYFILGIFIMLTLNFGLFIVIFLNFQADKRKESKQNLTLSQSEKRQKEHSIRSDLNVPARPAFLDRTELITQINDKFKNQKGIQALAFVGPGGAGKTTLARQYVAPQKANVIWELNAETNERLRSSFENLAQALAKTDQDQKILREIQDVKDPEQKENQIISFVKERLHIHSNWFLIYDNVEKFTDIQRYFPQDSQTWGEGKIILTTRNNNIQNNKHISSTIQVGELTPDQKLALFTKIMGQEGLYSFSSFQIEDLKTFLEKLPPFPLDISIAAYYLRATNISYTAYLADLTKNNRDFANVQEELLKEAGDYTKNRYDIITLSLQKIINAHKDFKDLLLFISLLDSQNIPRELLGKYKEKTIVDNFIYNLNKYSLITNDLNSLSSGATFSIHRNTQEISLTYLIKRLNLEENTQLLQLIVDTLLKYMVELIDKEDVLRMKSLIPHGEIFLSQNKLLNDAMKESIRNELGRIYFDLAYFIKARSLFEENIIKANKKNNKLYIARALTGLGIVYKELGDYKEAKDLLQESILIYKNYFPENHRDRAHALLYLGSVYVSLGDYENAKNLLEESVTVYKHCLPENYAYGVRALASLGNIYRALGNYKEAKNLLEQSLIICRKHLPKNHIGLVRILTYLGTVNEEIGHNEEAKNLIEQSLVICKENFSENHLGTAQVAMHLGNAYIAVGQYAKAKGLLEQSLKVFQQYYPEKHIFNVRVLTSLGKIYTKLNDYEKAKSLLEKSLKIYITNFDENDIETAKILGALGQVYFLEDHLDDAENLFMRALVIFQKVGHPNIYMAFEDLAQFFLKKAKNEENKGNLNQSQNFRAKTLAYLKQAQETVEKYFPKDSPHMTRIQFKLKNIQ